MQLPTSVCLNQTQPLREVTAMNPFLNKAHESLALLVFFFSNSPFRALQMSPIPYTVKPRTQAVPITVFSTQIILLQKYYTVKGFWHLHAEKIKQLFL